LFVAVNDDGDDGDERWEIESNGIVMEAVMDVAGA